MRRFAARNRYFLQRSLFLQAEKGSATPNDWRSASQAGSQSGSRERHVEEEAVEICSRHELTGRRACAAPSRGKSRVRMAEWVPTNHKADEKEAARNRKKLMKIIKLPQNQICADCPIKRVALHTLQHQSPPSPPGLLVPDPPRYLSFRKGAHLISLDACLVRSGTERVGGHQPRRVHLLPVLGNPSQPRNAHL